MRVLPRGNHIAMLHIHRFQLNAIRDQSSNYAASCEIGDFV
jgi:hypothetical protein